MHAIDLSEENIAYARKHHPGPTFEVMSAEALAYPDAYFDVVYAIDILEHVDSVEKTVAEIHRVLKLGGKVVLNIPAADSEEWLLRLRPTYHAEINHVRIFRGDELETVMREHGLTLTKKQARDFSDHAILYYLFTRTTSSHSQLGIGDWRDTWVGRAIFLSHALTKPNLVFTSPLKYIPVWVIGIPAGWVVNGIGNRFFPKSMYYEFIKEK